MLRPAEAAPERAKRGPLLVYRRPDRNEGEPCPVEVPRVEGAPEGAPEGADRGG